MERTDSYFDGKVLELIGYGILSFLITAATLGIASAWAEKLLIAYKIDHTIYNGKRLKFEGTGASLFVQRFKWIFFTIITLGIYSFWIPIRMEQWIVSNIHFEDETFVKGESYFDGGVLGVIGVNLLCNFLTIISLGILYPFGICYKQKWLAKHTIINRKGIVFNGSSLSLIGHYLLWWFLTVITFGIYGFWLPIKMENWKAQNTHIRLKGEEEPKTSMVPAIIAIIIFVVLVVCTLVSAIIKYNNIKSDDTSDKFYIEKVLLDFKNNVNNETVDIEIKVKSSQNEDLKRGESYGLSLDERIKRVLNITDGLISSEFMNLLRDTSFVREPISKTAIFEEELNYRKALELYTFIENFEECPEDKDLSLIHI